MEERFGGRQIPPIFYIRGFLGCGLRENDQANDIVVVFKRNPNHWGKRRTFVIFNTNNVRFSPKTSIFFKFFQIKGLTDKKKSGILGKLARAGVERPARKRADRTLKTIQKREKRARKKGAGLNRKERTERGVREGEGPAERQRRFRRV